MENLLNNLEALIMIFGLICFFALLFVMGLDTKHTIYVNGVIVEVIENDGELAEEIFQIYKRYNKNQKDIIKLKSKFIF